MSGAGEALDDESTKTVVRVTGRAVGENEVLCTEELVELVDEVERVAVEETLLVELVDIEVDLELELELELGNEIVLELVGAGPVVALLPGSGTIGPIKSLGKNLSKA